MFVYLLITAELAVLYTVFWYLYLREPIGQHRIKGSLWGTYEEAIGDQGFDLDSALSSIHGCRCGGADKHVIDAAYVRPHELVLDHITNHYVPVSESGSVLVRLVNSIDKRLSHLNVRP